MWKDLNIALKSLLMSIFLRNGIDNINQMKSMYNQFQNGGPKVKSTDKFYSTMERVAENNDENNRFDIGGPKNPPIRTTGGAGYVPATDASYLLDKVRNRLYRTVNPYGNYDIPGSISDFLSGEDWASHMYILKGSDGKYYTDTFEDVTSPIEVVDDIWANYLNIPEDKRRFKTRLEKSAYVPGMKGNPNLTYFKLPLADYDVDRLIEETDELPVGKNIISEDFSSYNLGEHTIGRGFDDNGEYRSYYDRWDLNPFNGKYGGLDVPFINSLSDTTMGIGKPVEIYDRIYMDDYYDMPKGQQKSLYLPEVTIYGGKRRSIRNILNGLNNSKPNKKKAFGGELYPDGGILGNIPRMWQVDESNRFDTGGPTEKQRRALATQYFWENKMDKARQYAIPSVYEGGQLPEIKIFPERNQGEITPATDNALTRAINNYIGELKYDLKNNKVPSGKYTLPAAILGATGLTGLAKAGEMAYAAGATPLIMEGMNVPFTASGLNNLVHGNADWQTALEIAPLGHYVMPIAKRIFPRLAPKIVDKYAAIKEAYNRNPEISKVGSIDDYNDYLKTVFPESKIQDIQYHMGPKGIEELKGSTGEIWNTNPKAKGIYVSPTKEYPELIRKHTTDRIEKPSALKYLWRNLTGNWDKANAKYTEMYPVLINTKNPLYTSGNWTWGMNQNKYDEVFSNYDGIVNSGTKWYQKAYKMPETIVPSSDQTLILGSNRDLQGFKQFMSSKKTPTPQITAENAASITPEQWTAAQDNIFNRVRGFLGFADGGFIDGSDEFDRAIRPLNEYTLR